MKIHATMMLAHANLRKEMSGDEPGRTAVTASFKGTLPEDAVKPFFSTEASYKKVLGSMWNKDNELATHDVESLPLAVNITGGTAVLETPFGEKADFEQVSVSDVVLRPMNGRQIEVSLKMSVHPTKESLWFLAEHNRKTVTLTCVPSQMALDLGEGSDKLRKMQDEDREVSQDGDLPLDVTADAEAFAGMEVE